LVDREARPIPIPTLLGGTDSSGLVNIGETDNFERRRNDIIKGIEKCDKHSAGILFRYMRLFTRLSELWPGNELQYQYTQADSKQHAEDLEARAVKEYFIRFGQMPLLNRSMPKPFDDIVWNELWELAFGQSGLPQT
jgi:hypothetical protein